MKNRSGPIRLCNQSHVGFEENFRAMFITSTVAVLVVSALSASLNLTISFVITRLMKRNKVPPKSYLLLLNLSLTDGILSTIVLVHSIFNLVHFEGTGSKMADFTKRFHQSQDTIIKHVLRTSIVAAPALGYICLCTFEYVAVSYPFFYTSKITKRRVQQAIFVSWIVAFLAISLLCGLHVTAKIKKLKMDTLKRPATTTIPVEKTPRNATIAMPKILDTGLDLLSDDFKASMHIHEGKNHSSGTDLLQFRQKRFNFSRKKKRKLPPTLSSIFFSIYFMNYYVSEFVFNSLCLLVVGFCYLSVLRVVRRRECKLKFIRGLHLHFILFVLTTSICLIANCLSIYMTHYMDRNPKIPKPLRANENKVFGKDDLNPVLVLQYCTRLGKIRKTKGLIFSSLIAGFISLTRLLLDGIIYALSNPYIRKYLKECFKNVALGRKKSFLRRKFKTYRSQKHQSSCASNRSQNEESSWASTKSPINESFVVSTQV